MVLLYGHLNYISYNQRSETFWLPWTPPPDLWAHASLCTPSWRHGHLRQGRNDHNNNPCKPYKLVKMTHLSNCRIQAVHPPSILWGNKGEYIVFSLRTNNCTTYSRRLLVKRYTWTQLCKQECFSDGIRSPTISEPAVFVWGVTKQQHIFSVNGAMLTGTGTFKVLGCSCYQRMRINSELSVEMTVLDFDTRVSNKNFSPMLT